jgi:hypothetical protein
VKNIKYSYQQEKIKLFVFGTDQIGWSGILWLKREISFQETISTICLANENGDLLLGIENRIDLVKASTCKKIIIFRPSRCSEGTICKSRDQ